VDWIAPGERAAAAGLREFIEQRLEHYPERRNDPNAEATSRLSPWLHFGQLSPQYAAWEAWRSDVPPAAREAFIEELVVRRELSDNFCHYNPEHYDSLDGIHPWARATLDQHRRDRREYVYSYGEFERGATHDPLWNAAQRELVTLGTMPGYLRMYWAKKILEWSDTPELAVETALRLNDRWQLDGRDPNGYVGVLWSIGGLHDRAWSERPVFGKVRYMNYNGCRRKFDVDAYIARVQRLAGKS
jgi:deoxyribodipyrimidine photo-lyase